MQGPGKSLDNTPPICVYETVLRKSGNHNCLDRVPQGCQDVLGHVLLGHSLHVIEPELFLHVAIRHLTERLLVVLHEPEDGSQLFFLHSVEKRG